MKKFILPFLLIFILSLILGGCENNEDNKLPLPQLSVLGEELLTATAMQNPMELTPDEAEMIMGISAGDISESYIRISEEAIESEMVCLIKCTDEAAAERVKTAISSYISHQAATFQSYLPEEYAKLKDVTAKADGIYVYAAVGSDRDTINEIFARYFK